jgi:hypothetical protein
MPHNPNIYATSGIIGLTQRYFRLSKLNTLLKSLRIVDKYLLYNGPKLNSSHRWIHQQLADIFVTFLCSRPQGPAVSRVRQGPVLNSSHRWIT